MRALEREQLFYSLPERDQGAVNDLLKGNVPSPCDGLDDEEAEVDRAKAGRAVALDPGLQFTAVSFVALPERGVRVRDGEEGLVAVGRGEQLGHVAGLAPPAA